MKLTNARAALAAVAACIALALAGCHTSAFFADAVAPYVTPPVLVEAEYRGLENQRVAVLVDADLSILFEHPLAQLEVCSAVSERLAANVPGVQVLDARQVVDFQQRNIYWNTTPYADIAKRLNVSRLVLIDLIDYRLHERGNVNIWRGTISGSVGVAETDGDRPNDEAYRTTVAAAYPPDRPMGVVKAQEQTIRLGALDLFSRGVAGRFHDYEEKRTP